MLLGSIVESVNHPSSVREVSEREIVFLVCVCVGGVCEKEREKKRLTAELGQLTG